MVYRLSMFYLVRNEASYQCFEVSLYGVVCFYNKCTLIKVALEVSIDGIVFPTNSITIFIAEIAYLFRRSTVQFIAPKVWLHLNLRFARGPGLHT